MKKSILTFILLSLLLGSPIFCHAQDLAASTDVEEYSFNFDQNYLAKGHTIALVDNGFRLGFFPKVLKKVTTVVVKKRIEVVHPLPDNYVPLSDLWEFDIMDKEAYDAARPIALRLVYQESEYYKKIIFWNGQEWQDLPSKVVDLPNRIIQANFFLPYARFLVVGDKTKLAEGRASWYRYKNCLCAASPDYKKGSILRVTAVDSGKSVEVTVNDFGPDRSVHPDRPIDLDLVAFKKIAKKSVGLINVLVEPVLIKK